MPADYTEEGGFELQSLEAITLFVYWWGYCPLYTLYPWNDKGREKKSTSGCNVIMSSLSPMRSPIPCRQVNHLGAVKTQDLGLQVRTQVKILPCKKKKKFFCQSQFNLSKTFLKAQLSYKYHLMVFSVWFLWLITSADNFLCTLTNRPLSKYADI